MLVLTGSLTCGLALGAPHNTAAQTTSPSGQSPAGSGRGVLSNPGSQGVTDQAGQTPQVPTGTNTQPPGGRGGVDPRAGQGTQSGEENRNPAADTTRDPKGNDRSRTTERGADNNASQGATGPGTQDTGAAGASGTTNRSTGSSGSGMSGASSGGTTGGSSVNRSGADAMHAESGTPGAAGTTGADATPGASNPASTSGSMWVIALLAIGALVAFGALRMARTKQR